MTRVSPGSVDPLQVDGSPPPAGAHAGDIASKGMNMKKWKRIWICVTTLLVLTWLTAGCNTIHGAGKDLEAGGEAIQDAAD